MAETDISPELLEELEKAFEKYLANDKTAEALLKQIQDGTANYTIAGKYADHVGEALAKSFQEVISSDVLPDGKMYQNIAEKTVVPMFTEDYSLVSAAATQTQQALNEAAGIGLKAQTADLNEDRITGIVTRLSSADQYDNAAWILNEPVVTFSRSIVDDTLKKNIDFQGKAGKRPKVIRTASTKCCDWCSDLEGVYEYPNVPQNVYSRHENCRCDVEYDPGSNYRNYGVSEGQTQNVWSKQWSDPEESAKIEERKQIGLRNLTSFSSGQYRDILKSNVDLDEYKIVSAAENGGRNSGWIAQSQAKSNSQLQKSISSHTDQVQHHADKIANPEKYVRNWDDMDLRCQEGTILKWEKDMQRNAEEAIIEINELEKRNRR